MMTGLGARYRWMGICIAAALAAACSGEFGERDPVDAGIDTFPSDVSDIGQDIDEGPWADLPPRPWPSTEPGPFEVAYRYDSFEYTPRGEGEEPRPIEVSIWYPTFEEDGQKARYIGLINRDGIWQDAPPAIRDTAPVMLFSHGSSALSVQSYFWTEFLASHGWIVIAPDHLGNTFAGDGPSVENAVYRPQDISASLDYFLDLPPEDPLYDTASDDIAVSGHSFGGTTTLMIAGNTFPTDYLVEACEADEIPEDYCEIVDEDFNHEFEEGFFDPRLSAAIPQSPAGGPVLEHGVDAIEMPLLLWTAHDDAVTTNEVDGDPIWENLVGSNKVRIDKLETAHFTLSNMCEHFSGVDDVAEQGCGDEFLAPEVVHPLHNAYSLEFLRLHLFGDDEAASWFGPDHEPLHENFIFYFK